MNELNRPRAYLGLTLLVISLVPVFAGWLSGNSTWITWLSKYGVMRFNTALCFLLLFSTFISILLQKKRLTILFATILLALAGGSLLEYLLKVDLAIDQIFIKDFLPPEQGKYPGRMSPASATAFLICGLSCLPSIYKNIYAKRISNILLSLVMAEGIFSLMTLFGLPKSLLLVFSGGLSTHTGLLFLTCSCTILYANNKDSSANSLIGWIPLAGAALIAYISLNTWLTFRYSFFTTFYQDESPVTISGRLLSRELIEQVGADIAQAVLVIGLLYALLAAFCLYLYFKARLNRDALLNTNHALALSEGRSQAFLNFAPEAIVVVNRTGVITFANKRTENVFGYQVDELLHKHIECLVPQHLRENHVKHRIRYVENPTQRDMGADLDLWATRKDGTQFPVDVMLGPIQVGEEMMTMAIVRDVTDEKEAEQIITSSLQEKETLLKEVYHRVKNNMQVISSLLKMQARKQPDNAARQALEDSASRVNTMALVHEKLYQSKNLSQVNFPDYAETLLQHLSHTMQSQQNVEIKTCIIPANFDVDTLIPLGLILSELVSNSYKHAFKDHLSATISVDLSKQDNHYQMTVEDNGQGLPENFEVVKASSLGMLLVHNLINQLHGKLDVQSRNTGTAFVIQFPIPA